MNKADIFKFNEFIPYFFIGASVTFIDWTIFWVSISFLDLHYEIALTISFVVAAMIHYTANKTITFNCKTKAIRSQFFLYFIVSLISLFLSMSVLAFFINVINLTDMYARILTSMFMLIPNYLLHKHITFSKKLFLQY